MGAYTFRNVVPVGFEDGARRDIHVDAEGRLADRHTAGADEIECNGAYVSPGWADLHTHIWYGGTDFSVRADDAGMARGVTVMVDAGSAGEASFHGLREYVISRQRETVRAFINIGSIGLVAANRVSELALPHSIDVERTRRVIEANRDVICGIKIRCSGTVVGAQGIAPLRVGTALARDMGLPVMVHIGEAPPEIEQVLELLSPGDLVTHCFHGKPGASLLETPERIATARRASARGVLFDIGHGAASYSFRSAARAIANGLLPFSISTDLHQRNINGPVYDLATTVSKLHAAGLSFEACVAAVTTHPRQFLRLPSGTGLSTGARADLTIFTVEDKDIEMQDSLGDTLRVRRLFAPQWAAIGAHVQPAGSSNRQPASHSIK